MILNHPYCWIQELTVLYKSLSHPQKIRADSVGNGLMGYREFSDEESPNQPLYPLPPNSPYTFRRKTSEHLEPVGEFQEFQSAEGNSRQVLMHVWPPSELDTALLKKLESCCRDFQENEIVRGHSGDGFLNGWRPSWKQPNRTGILRFGHWRVRAPDGTGEQLYVSHGFLYAYNVCGTSESETLSSAHLLCYRLLFKHR
jgi:hypothetical protein